MTYNQFKKLAGEDPVLRSKIHEFHEDQGNYAGDFLEFERLPSGQKESYFTTFYARNRDEAEDEVTRALEERCRSERRRSQARNGRNTNNSLLRNTSFKRSAALIPAGLAIWAGGYFGIEDSENIVRETMNIAGPALSLTGVVLSGISAGFHYLTR
jgi:hypothetical protein